MRALVVYESVFGNTERIAHAISDALSARHEVTVSEVGSAPTQLGEFDLVIVGGPTHAWGMSRANGRLNAAKNADRESITGDFGLREWLKTVEHVSSTFAAAFDTRARGPFLWILPTGSAARGIASRLRKLGFVMVVPNEGFRVSGTEGPLEEGELERATAWAKHLGDTAARLSSFGREMPSTKAA